MSELKFVLAVNRSLREKFDAVCLCSGAIQAPEASCFSQFLLNSVVFVNAAYKFYKGSLIEVQHVVTSTKFGSFFKPKMAVRTANFKAHENQVT